MKEEVEACFFGLFPQLRFERASHGASFWVHRIYRDVRLRKVPKGFPEDHPAAELLKLKDVTG